MAFRNLSARITGDSTSYVTATQTAKRAASSFGSEATSLAAKLQLLQGRADEAESEIDSVGRSATSTSTSFTALTASTEGLALSFGSLGTTTSVTLIPAMVALSTVLLPLAATFGGLATAAASLAGAFGLVIGSGLIAFGQKRGEQNAQRLAQIRARIAGLESLRQETGQLTAAQRQQLQTLQEQEESLQNQTGVLGGLQSAIGDVVAEIKPMIVAFGQEFIPLIEAGFEAIPQLVENILEAVGGLSAFKDALGDAGEAAMQAIPNMVAALMDIAREALPALRRGAAWLMRNGPRIFRGMMRTTRQVLPLLQRLVLAFVDAAPTLNRFGTAIIEYVVPGVTSAVNAVAGLVDWWNNLNGIIKTALIIGVGSAIAALGSGVVALVAAVVAAVEIWDVFKSVVIAVVDVVSDAVSTISGLGGGVIDEFSSLGSWLVSTGSSVVGDGVAAIVESAKAVWDWFTGTGDGTLLGGIKSTVDAIPGLFTDAVQGLEDVVNQAMGLPWTISIPSVTIAGHTIGGGSITIPKIGGSGGATNGWPDDINRSPGNDGGGSFGDRPGTGDDGGGGGADVGPGLTMPSAASGGLITRTGVALVHQGERIVPEAQVQDRGPAPPSQVVLRLEGVEGRLGEVFREEAEVVVQEAETATQRRVQRLQSRGDLG